MKTCVKCDKEKDFCEFPVRRHRGKESYRSECKSCTSSYMKSYAQKNEAVLKSKKKIYSQENSARAVERAMAWNKRNPGKVNYYTAKRRSAKLNATPAWLSDAQKDEIKRIYVVCDKVTESTGKPHHVDHIVPLQGDDVCGLHVPWNLAIIPAKMNLAKGNR